MVEFNNKFRTRTKKGKIRRINTFKSINPVYKGRK